MLQTRRLFLHAGSAAAITATTGCLGQGEGALPRAGAAALPPLIDAHCHLFNVTDLSAATFLRIVFLGMYDEQPELKAGSPLGALQDSGFLDELIRFILDVLSIGSPTARRELERAYGGSLTPPSREEASAEDFEASRRFIEARLAERLESRSVVGGPDELRAAILRAAGQEAGFTDTLSRAQAVTVAAQAFASETDLGLILRWVRTLRMSRRSLTRRLTAEHQRNSGRVAALLTPAMVDYAAWLGEEPKSGSSFQEQVELGARIAADPALTPSHGYVGYDPLRQAIHASRPDRAYGRWNALGLVRTATLDKGFIGVKLYPPMGFRASGNGAATPLTNPIYQRMGLPQTVESAVPAGSMLDRALGDLYGFCEAEGVPIMAHGGPGNQAGPSFGQRADPRYWTPVFDAHPNLQVMLAHFGSFSHKTGGWTEGDDTIPPFEQTWEAEFGRYVKARPEASVFADISYRSNIFEPAKRAACAAGLVAYIEEYDRDARHLVFGSDWVMMGMNKGWADYTHDVLEFLDKDCRLTSTQIENVLHLNAVRFLGLQEGGKSLSRIQRFYAANGLPQDRLRMA